MSTESHLMMLPGVDSDVAASAAPVVGKIVSEIPDMPTKLSAKEKKIWNHVTQALQEYGLIHRTDGLTLTIICKTYVEWVDATEEWERVKKQNGGSLVESSNGHISTHPLYYTVRDCRKALLVWLPEAALTIPSFHKIKGNQIEDSQGSLFDDPIENFKSRKTAIGMRVVGKK